MILSYPVISSGKFAHTGSFEALLGADSSDPEKRKKQSLEFQVTTDTPPTFLWHTVTDDCVPVENSLLFFEALHKYKVPVELHLYPTGVHGSVLQMKRHVMKMVDVFSRNASHGWNLRVHGSGIYKKRKRCSINRKTFFFL